MNNKLLLLAVPIGLSVATAPAQAGTPVTPGTPRTQSQQQQQRQNQNVYVEPGNNYSDNRNYVEGKSRSNSEAASTNETFNSQNNVQVIESSSIYEFRTGVSAPVPTISGSIYANTNFDRSDIGGAVTFTIPLGGSTGERHGRLQEAIVNGEELLVAQTLVTTCANLHAAGFTVNEVEGLPGSEILSKCDELLSKNTRVVQLPPEPAPPSAIPPQSVPVRQPSVVPQAPTPPEAPIRGLW